MAKKNEPKAGAKTGFDNSVSATVAPAAQQQASPEEVEMMNTPIFLVGARKNSVSDVWDAELKRRAATGTAQATVAQASNTPSDSRVAADVKLQDNDDLAKGPIVKDGKKVEVTEGGLGGNGTYLDGKVAHGVDGGLTVVLPQGRKIELNGGYYSTDGLVAIRPAGAVSETPQMNQAAIGIGQSADLGAKIVAWEGKDSGGNSYRIVTNGQALLVNRWDGSKWAGLGGATLQFNTPGNTRAGAGLVYNTEDGFGGHANIGKTANFAGGRTQVSVNGAAELYERGERVTAELVATTLSSVNAVTGEHTYGSARAHVSHQNMNGRADTTAGGMVGLYGLRRDESGNPYVAKTVQLGGERVIASEGFRNTTPATSTTPATAIPSANATVAKLEAQGALPNQGHTLVGLGVAGIETEIAGARSPFHPRVYAMINSNPGSGGKIGRVNVDWFAKLGADIGMNGGKTGPYGEVGLNLSGRKNPSPNDSKSADYKANREYRVDLVNECKAKLGYAEELLGQARAAQAEEAKRTNPNAKEAAKAIADANIVKAKGLVVDVDQIARVESLGSALNDPIDTLKVRNQAVFGPQPPEVVARVNQLAQAPVTPVTTTPETSAKGSKKPVVSKTGKHPKAPTPPVKEKPYTVPESTHPVTSLTNPKRDPQVPPPPVKDPVIDPGHLRFIDAVQRQFSAPPTIAIPPKSPQTPVKPNDPGDPGGPPGEGGIGSVTPNNPHFDAILKGLDKVELAGGAPLKPVQPGQKDKDNGVA